MKIKKKINTPFTDIHGEIIAVGDVIVFGFLGQHWKVKQAATSVGTWRKKGDFIITIVSEDSGKGYTEDMKNCGIELPENETEICKEHCYD